MALSIEWRKRVKQWREELKRHFYVPLGEMSVSGFVTGEQLSAEEALGRKFRPMPVGTKYGGKWEYGWFKGEVITPAEASGQRLVLAIDLGVSGVLVFVDGQERGSRDDGRAQLALSRSAEAGRRHEVLMEAYAGHGIRPCSCGPVPPDRVTVPEPPAEQGTVGRITYGVWQEDVYQLWLDMDTLASLRDAIDGESLRVDKIDAALREVTRVVDFELSREEMVATCCKGREILRPLLACRNGSTAPTMYAFGHGHLDVAWLWPLAETARKMARTTANQLALMEEYPQYKFIHSQPHLYTMLKKHYPRLYERLCAAVRGGQVIAEGAMWVEADTNISGGESLIRQIFYGKRFFREEFGVESRMLWLPDVFGYSGALPQILRGCEVEYFSTAKIFWAYNGGDAFPYDTFTWEGIDGSEVKVHLCRDYNLLTTPEQVVGRWNKRLDRTGGETMLLPFGWGDGGGGPGRDHVEYVRRMGDLEGAPRVRMASPVEYFDDLSARGWPEARYVGELYFQAHRGTYTSQARTKLGNRKSEFALREAEMWGAMASALADRGYAADELRDCWTAVLLNQFHDIIPGSSVARVYEEAEEAYDRVRQTAGAQADEARRALAGMVDGAGNGGGSGECLTLFNSLNWQRTELVELPDNWESAEDESGRALPVQQRGDSRVAEVTVGGIGWSSIRRGGLASAAEEVEAGGGGVSASAEHLENEELRVELNERGEISRVVDKRAGCELSAGICNRLRMYRDTTTEYDAWDIDSMYKELPVELGAAAKVELVSAGPLVGEVLVTRRLHDSLMRQWISLRRGSRRVEFRTEIDWQERHKLLKVDFPVKVQADHALHEIQFGHLSRPNHASRPFDADRFEVSAHKWTALAENGRGAAVLNDCKYGVSVSGNCISLTLLKSSLAPDMNADRGRQVFTYALTAWQGSFLECDVVRQGYELNCPLTVAAGGGGSRHLIEVDAANVIVDTVKPAEDGSGDVIVRMYESKRTATRCRLRFGFEVESVRTVNMLEESAGDVLPGGGAEGFELELGAFEIRTLRVIIAGGK